MRRAVAQTRGTTGAGSGTHGDWRTDGTGVPIATATVLAATVVTVSGVAAAVEKAAVEEVVASATAAEPTVEGAGS